jgi:RNase P/RNase MRP subunit POP5
MQDKTFGWTVEMQVKAAILKLKCIEIPVKYRVRIGVSKVSGTIKGTILAGYKILWTIFKLI